ncbi:MAG: hypothetical protein LQ339_005815 [Xanthoria mediterranea]|nr:MAG: hypothetical protein LQ339_005815 [Xanthoria mediterranea]
MSTFKGVVPEFPDIRIDYFRTIAGRTPPLACFLSHIHSDHLQGLESLKAPFVYCSNSTRELLLRIEKYPHRMNFAKGILEARRQHYKHLKLLLKPIPLNVPTEIELKPGYFIRVSLFDANHCPGAVMFLIEDNSKAILYTGDIRAEPWWVNSVARQPTLLPYTHGLRYLDRIYLDTTFAVNSEPYRSFPTKAQGLSDLLREISKFPGDTVFHFDAWTLGYEEVWMALAAHLGSQIHVDEYAWRLYRSLPSSGGSPSDSVEGAALCGFQLGNRTQAGCLTQDDSVRLHSCEHGTNCSSLETSKNTVWITPLINRSDQGDTLELGAGGGGGDLTQTHELEITDPQAGLKLIELCRHQLHDDKELAQIVCLLEKILCSDGKTVPLNLLDTSLEENDIPLEDFAQLLIGVANRKHCRQDRTDHPVQSLNGLYPERIQLVLNIDEESRRSLVRSEAMRAMGFAKEHQRFPYSRHSSYTELCHFLSIFRPVDIYPCVTDKENWSPEVSIEGLFGHLCRGTVFSHDHEMRLVPGRILHRSSSPLQSSGERGERGESATHEPSRFGLKSGCGLLSLQSASGRLSPVNGKASDKDGGSLRPNKRQGSTDITSPTTRRAKLGMPSQERPERQDGGVLAPSFLEWLNPQGGESGRTNRIWSERIDGEKMAITTRRKWNPSPPIARSGGELSESPSNQAHQLLGPSNPLGVGHQGSVEDDDASSQLSRSKGFNTCREKVPVTGTGTQCDPIALSDTLEPRMDMEDDDET